MGKPDKEFEWDPDALPEWKPPEAGTDKLPEGFVVDQQSDPWADLPDWVPPEKRDPDQPTLEEVLRDALKEKEPD
jgi:hypothetical protein